MNVLANTPMEHYYLETLAMTFISITRQNHLIRENNLDTILNCGIVLAVAANFSFTGSSNEEPVWKQHFNLIQLRIFRGGHPDLDAVENFHLNFTKKETISFQDDVLSIANGNFNKH